MVLEAAKSVEIIDLISRGTVEPLVNGSQLSGGQKQRIALARAFLKPAPILLLMKLRQLWMLIEASIAGSLKNFLKIERQLPLLKLSSIRDADMIFVMDDAELIESGTMMIS